jgi:hypothetical protein
LPEYNNAEHGRCYQQGLTENHQHCFPFN